MDLDAIWDCEWVGRGMGALDGVLHLQMLFEDRAWRCDDVRWQSIPDASCSYSEGAVTAGDTMHWWNVPPGALKTNGVAIDSSMSGIISTIQISLR